MNANVFSGSAIGWLIINGLVALGCWTVTWLITGSLTEGLKYEFAAIPSTCILLALLNEHHRQPPLNMEVLIIYSARRRTR